MNYCIYLKERKNRPFCKLINKEISFSQCRECNDKQYKTKSKSKKLANLEKNRKSVFTTDLNHCYLCGRKKEELHEIFAGRNRANSMKYNFVLPLCHECHSLNQNNPLFNDFWHRKAQLYWEEHIGSREEFIKVFRRDYLKK